MPQTMEELMDAAMELPEEERAELAELLAATVGRKPGSLHPAWAAEVRRRAAEIDSGAVQPIPLEEVRRRIQARLSEASLTVDLLRPEEDEAWSHLQSEQ